MIELRSDALVFFGATGDLAAKKIFPALQAMIERGELDMPKIGVARAGWTLEKLRERARERGSLPAAGSTQSSNVSREKISTDAGTRSALAGIATRTSRLSLIVVCAGLVALLLINHQLPTQCLS